MNINSITNISGSGAEINIGKRTIKLDAQGYLGYQAPGIEFIGFTKEREPIYPSQKPSHTSGNLGFADFNKRHFLFITSKLAYITNTRII
jgi:hypothetical protein